MKKMLKGLMIAALVLTIAVPAISMTALPVSATTLNVGAEYANKTGLGNTDPRAIAANIINIALTCLAILAVIIILIGGFKWMTAAGNEEQIEEAKKVLVAGIIGLVIIFAAWGLATFIINSMANATSLPNPV